MSHAAQAVAPKDPTDPAPVDAITQNEITPALPVTQNDAGEENPVGGSKKKGLGQIALIFACGTALFSDGYVNAVAGPVNTILKGYVYKPQADADPEFATFLKHFSERFSALVFAGTVAGMLVFGVLSDRIGRKSGMIFASIWLTIWSVISAGAWGAGGSTKGLFAALEAYRFLQGIAIGAEYPAGSVAASENTEHPSVTKNRQQMLFTLATNSMIDVGFVVANFVPLVLLWIFGMDQLEWVWRLSLGLGAIPPLAVLFFRFRMAEPEHYKKNAMKRKVPWWLIFKRYWVRLTAICLSWFIYDYVSYPGSIYSTIITDSIIPNGTLYQVFGWGVVINLFYWPGTFIGALVNDRLGPRNTMVIGLLLQSIVGWILSGAFSKLREHIAAFAVVYGIFLSLGEFGPGNNLGLLASKACGPTAVRGTFYGIAAAIGKIGAFTGTYAYNQIQLDLGTPDSSIYYSGPFYIASGLALLSAAITFFFIPNPEADGMIKEDLAFREYLIENGYDVSQMGLAPTEDEERAPSSEGSLAHENEKEVTISTAERML